VRNSRNNSFQNKVITLLSGSTIAQVIPIIIAPVLSRLYTPEEFGILGIFLATIQIIAPISTGRYEFALVATEKKVDAFHLFVISLSLVTMTSVLTFIGIQLFKDKISLILEIENFNSYLNIIPAGIFLLGVHQTVNYYNIREGKFKSISIANISKSGSRSTVNLVLGFFSLKNWGLILGELSSLIVYDFILLKNLRQSLRKPRIKLKQIRHNLSRYKRYPLVSIWAIFINLLSQNINHFFISKYFSIAQVGLYNHVIKYLNMPINMINNAVGQVLLQEASEARRTDGNAIKQFKTVFWKLSLYPLPIFVIMYFFIEDLFSWYFGETWREAGVYGRILLPYFYTRLVVSPLSNINMAFEKQLLGLYFSILLFTGVLSTYFIGIKYNSDIKSFLTLYSFIMSSAYIIILVFLYQVSKGRLNSKWF
jgi:O-antigen/teichoic acid export membrane protein